MYRFASSRAIAAVAGAAIAVPYLMSTRSSWVSSSYVNCSNASTTPVATALSPSEFRSFTLLTSEQLTHDTKRYVFALPNDTDELGLTVASALVVRAEIDGKPVIRPYTPTSRVHDKGTFELIVKTYPEGKISQKFWNLKPGDSLEMKGPFVKFKYQPNQWKSIGMLAGGTGITPMYQVLQELLADSSDRTEVRLLYASRTPADIILKNELDTLQAKHKNFKVFYTVDKATEGWNGNVGYITPDLIKSVLPGPGTIVSSTAAGETTTPLASETKIMVCGPPGFMKLLSGEKKSPADQGELTGLLKDMQYTQEQVFKF